MPERGREILRVGQPNPIGTRLDNCRMLGDNVERSRDMTCPSRSS